MLTPREEIQKFFYALNERVGSIMEVLSNTQRKGKHKYLVLTVTITKPNSIHFYIMKKQDGGELRNIPLFGSENLKKLDCRDSKTQPTYDIQLTTEYKTWTFRATKLEAKGEFITSFCRIVGSLQPQRFREIQLINLPSSVDLSSIQQHHSLESLLNPAGDGSKSTTGDPDVPVGSGNSEAYRPLTDREEEDIRQFLDELAMDSVQRNASELTEHLQQQLADVEGTNIHSIMASEAQVLKLMTILDQAISQADKLEQQMAHYHQYLSDVEEAMTTLRDRDQLIQVTMDNRGRLLRVLEDLVSRLTLDARYVRSLIEVKLDSSSDIVQCTEAARYLDALLNAPTTPGEEHLQAVDEQMNELKRLRDLFAAELAKKVNNTVVNFSRQLKFVINLGSSLAPEQGVSDNASQVNVSRNTVISSPSIRNVSELYKVQREELTQLAPLVGGWLRKNRPDVFNELKREYVRQMQSYFRHQTSELFNRAQQAIAGLIKPSKSSHSSRVLEASDTGSVISVHNPEASVLNQVATLVNDLLERIRMTVSTEEQFLAQFFNMQPTEDTQTRETSIYAMQNEVATLTGCMHALFRELESDGFAFVASCEQLQPILVMPLLVVISRQMESETPLSDQVNLAEKDHAAFITYFLARLTMATKRSFNRYIERLIQSFKDSKPSKKSRCGVLRIVLNYVDFAECSIAVFSRSKRMVDLERAHGELVRALMAQLEQIAFQSVKTPREVVQLENYHRLNDILRRLKMSGLEEYLQETKIRYTRALEEYTKNSMGRPLEKLATFFEGVQAALDAGVRPEVIQYQFAFSKQELRKVIREYPGREVKRGLESLCKKVEKHLSEEGNLFQVVWRSIQAQFLEQCQLFNVLINECYPDSGIALEFTIDHLQNYFAEIAHSR
ncbi:hypothetical protein P879_07136 [Paragonimus westermani]|uniref:Exocyst complex component 1 n=1 Tax=Paragonimus westermani TaxID=34504 RepID=A0A8T0D5X2_9TREM|nr:hypothetical protein P879_07136 [Paragonimus westermani]